MSKKYYVVWKGEKTGVFDNWQQVKNYTQGRADAQFMGFASKAEAEAAFQTSYTKALMKRSLTKSNTPSTSKNMPASTTKVAKKACLNHADINIYCDGACSPNPGKSGTGVAIYQQQHLVELWYGLYHPNGTNNTAELNGLLVAFRYAQKSVAEGKSVQILSDSKYGIDCITKWAKGWQAKGWTRGKGEAIKNLELIQQCFQLYEKLKQHITISHVKGHADIEGNELADRMAVYARNKQEKKLRQYDQTLDIKKILAMPSG